MDTVPIWQMMKWRPQIYEAELEKSGYVNQRGQVLAWVSVRVVHFTILFGIIDQKAFPCSFFPLPSFADGIYEAPEG